MYFLSFEVSAFKKLNNQKDTFNVFTMDECMKGGRALLCHCSVVSSLDDAPSSETSKKSRSNSTKDETENFFRTIFVTPIGSWPSYFVILGIYIHIYMLTAHHLGLGRAILVLQWMCPLLCCVTEGRGTAALLFSHSAQQLKSQRMSKSFNMLMSFTHYKPLMYLNKSLTKNKFYFMQY